MGGKLRPLFFFLAPGRTCKKGPWARGRLIFAVWAANMCVRKRAFFPLRRARLFRPRLLRLSQRAASAKLGGKTEAPIFFGPRENLQKGPLHPARSSNFRSLMGRKHVRAQTSFFFPLRRARLFRPRLPKGPALRLSQRAASAKLGGKTEAPFFFGPQENLQKGPLGRAVV